MFLPKPKTLAETGLTKELLFRLCLRHLQEEASLSLPVLAERLCRPAPCQTAGHE